jgi:hypothetical protein
MSVRLSVFQLEISGKDGNNLQLKNKKLISFIFIVFHFEISGNFGNEMQLENM